MLRFKHLVRIFFILAIGFLGGIWFANYQLTPSYNLQQEIVNSLDLSFPRDTIFMSLDRATFDPESDVLYQFSFVQDDGKNFCAINNLKAGNPKYELMLGKNLFMPDLVRKKLEGDFEKVICYGENISSKNRFFIMTEPSRVFIYYFAS